jgi:hypothetical protein
MAPSEDEQVAEIEQRFREKGWKLRLLKQDNGSWLGVYHLRIEGQPTAGHETMSPTKLGAAQAAWAQYERLNP